MKPQIICHIPVVALTVACLVILAQELPGYASKGNTKNSLRPAPEKLRRFSGNISWYGVPFHGRKTASGQPFDMNKLTAAHLTLPFGTHVLVENPKNGKSVIVIITDRGPHVKGRVLDVSREAARQLGTLLGGVAYVNCLVLVESSSQIGRAHL